MLLQLTLRLTLRLILSELALLRTTLQPVTIETIPHCQAHSPQMEKITQLRLFAAEPKLCEVDGYI